MVWLTRRSPSKNNEDGKANIRQLPEIILNVRRIINEIIKIQQGHQCHYYAIALIHMHAFQIHETILNVETLGFFAQLNSFYIAWIYRIVRDEC